MKVNVNLLQESQKIQLKIRKIGFLLQTGSVVVLVAFGFAVISLLSYTLYSGNQQKQVLEKIASIKDKVEELRLLEYKNELISNKLVLASRAIEEHRINHKIATDFFEFAVGKVEITEVIISENQTNLQFRGSVSGTVALVQFLEELTKFAQEKEIVSVKSDGFSLSEGAVYSFGLTLDIKEV